MAQFTLRNRDLERVHLVVSVPPVFRLRVWLGMKVIVLGAKITGMSIKLERTETSAGR